MSRIGAPCGLRHGRARVPFEFIELARDLYEYALCMPTVIRQMLIEACGVEVSINTLNDWIYYRTRVAG